MTRLFLVIIILIIMGTLGYTVVLHTSALSDQNSFLKDFLDNDFLSFIGLVLTISVASMSQLSVSLSNLEEKNQGLDLSDVKSEVKNTALVLIGLFVASFLVVLLKPIFATNCTSEAVFNSSAILIISLYVAVLTDVTLAVFSD